MSLTRQKKEQIVEELREKLSRASATVLTDYKGLTVAEMTQLRDLLAEHRVEYKVVKNTLMRIACKDTSAAVLEPLLEGTCAIAIGYDDPTVPARLLKKFSKENEKLKIKAGALGNRLLTPQEVLALADLPTKEQLMAKLLGVLVAVPTGLVSVLSGVPRSFVGVLAAIRAKKEEQGE
ncbi:50S ribosomal protein L10 [Thermodesulforhabdus norvegica]|uniref:Large ribosomal subunit protein uL10 n=1 Tax=Thermodesulforhabdus norvegica TaxID=39841 RepID=A0A1I4WE55_9BACT|nr:50S ribosomal protein L10 [Thermodesulforhabdus norvegica]SFN11540.1 LSU ribosomal protein L10P [Thermodesulforhabdus norvegica]